MNSHDRFIWNVSTPYLPNQAETWGWPDVEIEEVRLDRETSYERFTAGLGLAIKPATVPFTNTSCEWHLFDDLTYDLPHTLPFVCDQVLTYPKSTAIMLAATRPAFLEGFATAWRGMGFTGPILVPQECEGLPAGLPGVTSGPFADLVKKTDLFVFEFGLASQKVDDPTRVGREASAIDKKRLKAVEKLFREAASTEAETRPARRRLARRFIGVNVIYNKYWPIFTDYVGANINPFCSQVLAGSPLPSRPRCAARSCASASGRSSTATTPIRPSQPPSVPDVAVQWLGFARSGEYSSCSPVSRRHQPSRRRSARTTLPATPAIMNFTSTGAFPVRRPHVAVPGKPKTIAAA